MSSGSTKLQIRLKVNQGNILENESWLNMRALFQVCIPILQF